MLNHASWKTLLPELAMIQDRELADKVAAVYKEASEIGGWSSIEEITALPFSISHPEFGIGLMKHIHIVASLCDSAFRVLQKEQGEAYPLNYDYLIAGALLHDVGKIFAFTVDKEGKFVTSQHEKILRHSISGAGLAIKHGLPEEVCATIAYHSEEGIGKYRTPEGVLLNKMDYLAFDILKAFFGMKQIH